MLGVAVVARIYYLFFYKKKNVEGFDSLENCKKQGYPLDFCMRVPIQAYIG
jgi:hypothetical protein